ncbi:MAG: ABC transporter ATP-binding protein/permease [Bacillales bacterium]|nr:ABC transporter ATP-binding protein/permease [Bacillales bacterium]
MLRLKNIKKIYPVANSTLVALNGINLSFRKNEFVSILGPSGCGKTTTLNIIGGLDKYSEGDLFIAGKSTKEFKDRDWDVYRNQRIGFIFQSYNLIPHQTVLENVELALTISGMKKEERIEKAKKALDKVGLSKEYYKKPNQLSGGQSQRVAIARALVNEPEILLADEPTGALDTKTSIQIMDIIKEVAKDKLVIMVTHNPDLAEQYSSRIIRLLDGEVVEDTNPFSEEDEIKECQELNEEHLNKKSKAKMSLFQAIRLSTKNLLSKRKRTILTSIAGSIGIIGISAVLAISTGVKAYIASMEDDMLSGNPITITESTYDLNTIMGKMSTSDKIDVIKEAGFVNVESTIKYIVDRFGAMDSALIKNDINEDYVQYLLDMPEEYISALLFDYGLDLTNNIYVDFYKDDNTYENVSLSAVKNIYSSLLNKTEFAKYSYLIGQMNNILSQAPSNEDYILSQYDVKAGKIAKNKDEIMIVISKDEELSDILLAELGYYTQDVFMNQAFRHTDSPLYDPDLNKDKFAYEELLGKRFTWYPNDEVFEEQQIEALKSLNPFTYSYKGNGLQNGLELKVVGILQPKDSISYGCLSNGFFYTEELTKYVLEQNANSKLSTYINTQENKSITSGTITVNNAAIDMGIYYDYTFQYKDDPIEHGKGFVGNSSSSIYMSILGSMLPGGSGESSSNNNNLYTLSINEVGGSNKPTKVSVYPVDFDQKDLALNYMDNWNSDETITLSNGKVLLKENREDITYTDTLSLVIAMINTMINAITIALIVFTALSLVVSCVMISIITYVSVVERIKEIGVIRALGGRKKDVSHLFNAETLIIGLASGLVGVGVTYLLSIIVSVSINAAFGIRNIAILTPLNAIIMIALSVGLTMISGLSPSSKAAKQDPVVALRSE